MFKCFRLLRALFVFAALVSAVSWVATTSRANLSASRLAIPTTSELFGDQMLPYAGIGAVWIRPDGLVLVETADDGGIAFYADLDTLSLVRLVRGNVRFRPFDPGQDAIHTFLPLPEGSERICGTIFRHVGDVDLDYDESTGDLDLRVEAGSQIFAARFHFADSTDPSSTNAIIINPGPGQHTCYCYCSGPRGSCEAYKDCPEGYECSCSCTCDNDGNRCKCSPCRPLRRLNVGADPALDTDLDE